jgi:hypothetical protein
MVCWSRTYRLGLPPLESIALRFVTAPLTSRLENLNCDIITNATMKNPLASNKHTFAGDA